MVRELHSRTSSGVSVELLYTDKRDGEVWLHVVDASNRSSEFLCQVPDSEAMQAFIHPFLYQPVAK